MRITNLELLRFVSALGVVYFHAAGGLAARGFNLGPLGTLYSIGASGVDVFFVISGFVIYRGVLTSRRSPGDFLVARLKRIVPSYWILTALAVGFTSILEQTNTEGSLRSPTVPWVLSSLTFTSALAGNSPPVLYQGWSLEFEMLFYLLLTAALCITNKYLVALTPGVVLVTLVFVGHLNPRMLEFVAGMGVALFSLGRAKPKTGSLLTLCGVALLFLGHSWPWSFYAVDYITQLAAVLLVAGVVLMPQTKSRFAKSLGTSSYPVYLIQWFTIPVCLTIFSAFRSQAYLSTALILVVTIFATQIAGMIFNRLVDQPLANLLRKMSVKGKKTRGPEFMGPESFPV